MTVMGTVTHRRPHARAALELRRALGTPSRWTIVARAAVEKTGAFTLRWHVPKSEDPGPVRFRVVALTGSHRIFAATAGSESAIGQAAVPCAAATPPAVAIGVGEGWIAGGRITQGGPFPGIDACDPQQYTVTATGSGGQVAATQTVAGGQSYTLVVPAGTYTLTSDFCRGTATVTAGEQTTANTYCDVP
jgi:hypothetical protein